ncbi:MAG: hypothetical protein Q9220_004600 [cf. Caloplaca sp. 1 TL-2023]
MANVKDSTSADLKEMTAQATLKYSIKNYDAAAELYSQAVELQAQLRGEMATENAELLYDYGRCLFHLAVRSSDVLGTKVAGEKQTETPVEGRRSNHEGGSSSKNGTVPPGTMTAEGTIGQNALGAHENLTSRSRQDGSGNPYFQFTGDENFDDSDDGADERQSDGESKKEAEDDDDFANAFEVLDIARVLLRRRLEDEHASDDFHLESATKARHSQRIDRIKERLADTHDLQAEISLEGERFASAVVDLRAALDLKQAIFPKESSLIAEAHYKLALALEFSSVTQQKSDDGAAETDKVAQVDEAMREESAEEMEAAIASCRLRIMKEEHEKEEDSHSENGENNLTNAGSGDKRQRRIEDVKDMIADMEQRLVELREPLVSLKSGSNSGDPDGATQLGGIFGSLLGESPTTQRERLDEASKDAKDLTNLVKRRKPTAQPTTSIEEANSKDSGKRKVEFAEEVVEVGTGKKAKLADDDDADEIQ